MAEYFLKCRGMEVLNRNWRSGRLEVDLILKDKRYLVFCEVKTRNGLFELKPENAIGQKKIGNLTKAAGMFAQEHQHDGPVRFDLISISILPHGHQLFYVPDAFFPLGS